MDDASDISHLLAIQLDVGLRMRDPRWHCERTFELSLGDGKAEIFFIDTNPFIEYYRNVSWFNQEGERVTRALESRNRTGCRLQDPHTCEGHIPGWQTFRKARCVELVWAGLGG